MRMNFDRLSKARQKSVLPGLPSQLSALLYVLHRLLRFVIGYCISYIRVF
jgi:hypothetical protein